MKIEKINDRQIRCTLGKSDLEEYQIKLSELAYGNDKARTLFRDMMTKASAEFGFVAEDQPIMIEAIPISAECIILNITKVDCPEELDTRFSRFTNAPEDADETKENALPEFLESASDILDLFKKAAAAAAAGASAGEKPAKKEAPAKEAKPAEPTADAPVEIDLTKLYMFPHLRDVSRACRVIAPFFSGESALYKDPVDNYYYLFLKKSSMSPEEFNKVCNIYSEYAKQSAYSASVRAFFDEHCESIVPENAVAVMASI